MAALSVAAQYLEVHVLDPASGQIPTAVVSIGDREVPADDSGIATLCGLGSGPHSIVVIAPGFEPAEVVVRQPTGEITAVLQIEAVA